MGGYCDKCKGSGFVIKKQKHEQADIEIDFVCICTCWAGIEREENYPKLLEKVEEFKV